jgi:hypothetical protein
MSWLISKALMNSLCSQELAVESLVDTCLDGEQSVLSNGNNIPQAYCAPDKMTGFSRLSRFGMTYKPLMENRGEELLTLYLAAFPVRTFPSRDEAQGLMEKVPQCGITWRGWLAKFDPDSYSWKTAQCSFIEESGECLATFPASGLTRGGLLWEQTRLERPTKGIERGLWRTPDTGGGGTSGLLKKGQNHRKNGQPIQIRLVDQVNNPRLWPTPVARMYKDGGSPAEYARNEIPLAAQVGGPLNPEWVEWLMGWPQEWTDLKPLATDKFHKWSQQSGGN